MTKSIRRISQILFFGLFIYLISITAYPLKEWPEVHIFLSIDPLIALSTMLSSRSFIESLLVAPLVIVVLTLILGRVFCGWLCPMGTTLDISDKIFFRKRRKRRPLVIRKLKYYILAALIAASLFTTQAVYLLDPISLLTRTVVIVFVAPVQMSLKWLADHFYEWSSATGTFGNASLWISDRLNDMQPVSGTQLHFRQVVPVLVIFLVIIGLNKISRRFWCRNLCPLGALLGLLSRVPLLKRVVSSSCNKCHRCIPDCKMAAIPDNPDLTRTAECIECFDCVQVCPQDSISFKFRTGSVRSRETAIDLSRRRLVLGVGAGLAAAALVKADPVRKIVSARPVEIGSKFLIRPPGADVESAFVDKCVRCGECMKVCPTGGLQPCITEAGIEGFWTPTLVPRIGACMFTCSACSKVCPSEAIRKYELEEKKNIHIGTADVDDTRCIAWAEGKKCLVCHEFCPYGAIRIEYKNGIGCPVVKPGACVGCGNCEFGCPVIPIAAIRVHPPGTVVGGRQRRNSSS